MRHYHAILQKRGFTLIEVLMAAALMVVMFVGIYGAVQSSLKLLHNTKVSTGAVALANERIEYIRSLSYDDIGTVGGIPDGPIPQHATTSLNQIIFHERILIQYIDSPDDGEGASDTNGILADYKQVKVEFSWADISGTSTVFLLTNVVPPGIESTDGGGTLTVNVFDAAVLPVSGAEVSIYNDTTTTTISTSRFTNANGVAMFAGAPAAANYHITVTKPGYSTDRTIGATTSNPNPVTPHVAVVESQVSTMNFQIDELSSLRIRTVEPSTSDQFTDSFVDATNVATSTDVTVGSGSAMLAGYPGPFTASGMIQATATRPVTISSWDTIGWDAAIPASTTLMMRVYSENAGVYTLVPDADLPNNSTGFSAAPINISGLDIGTYPALSVGAVLGTTDTSTSSVLRSWEINYIISEPAIPSIPFTLRSQKTIGASPTIYKYEESHSTDAGGEIELTGLEWDFYDVILGTGAYDISEACPSVPYTLDPNTNETLRLTLVPAAVYSLRVQVTDLTGSPVLGATVDVTRTAFSDSGTTSSCGQVFFNTGLILQTDYVVAVSAPGYVTQTISDVNIDGTNTLTVTLNEI